MGQELPMDLNSTKAKLLGERIHRAFGSWQKAREAARRDADGAYLVPIPLAARGQSPAE
jgi:hypothetical protein